MAVEKNTIQIKFFKQKLREYSQGTQARDLFFVLSLCLTTALQYLPKRNSDTHSDFTTATRENLKIAWLWWSVGLTLAVPQDCIYLHTLKAAT